VLTHQVKHLTTYEQSEVLAYKFVYYFGKSAEKIHANKMLDYNDGFDEQDGEYKIVVHDHISYRYEIISLLGEGSFGKVIW